LGAKEAEVDKYNRAGTDLGSGSAFDHLMSSARGSCSRPVDETVSLSVLFSRR
jgi:hypothetical protein